MLGGCRYGQPNQCSYIHEAGQRESHLIPGRFYMYWDCYCPLTSNCKNHIQIGQGSLKDTDDFCDHAHPKDGS